MPEMHLRQPRLTYNACDHFLETKKRHKYFKRQRVHDISIKLNQIKLAFNMTWIMEVLMEDLPKRTACDKVWFDEAFNIANNSKYDGYQRGLASMFYKFFDKKTYGCAIKSKIVSNQELALELLLKSIIRTFEKRKTHSSLIDNIWSADLTDM